MRKFKGVAKRLAILMTGVMAISGGQVSIEANDVKLDNFSDLLSIDTTTSSILSMNGLDTQYTTSGNYQYTTSGIYTINKPIFKGSGLVKEPVGYQAAYSMMQRIYEEDLDNGGDSYWMDRVLGRSGKDPEGADIMTRGRALYMYGHNPGVLGFSGGTAYWHELEGGKDAYTISLSTGDVKEKVSERYQCPSYWSGSFTSGSISIKETKFITNENAAITLLTITNQGEEEQDVEITVQSPYAKIAEGDELTGVAKAKNELTTLYTKLSGENMSVEDSKLKGVFTLAPNENKEIKVIMGFTSKENPESEQEYQAYKKYNADEAKKQHMKEYNKWWADNIPYIDIPNESVKKVVYYRWWLNRFNMLDANIPGNDYQFPVSIEGVLGYNNAIVLTQPLHMQDLKYLRTPYYAYGDWVSAGEVSRDSLFVDNPGNPDNWNNSYCQYIGEAAMDTYKVHGGQIKILNNLARYAEKDAKGQLDRFDINNDYLIEYDWASLTGNDADAVAFHYFADRGDVTQTRTESAYVYGNAKAAAQAYELLGDSEKAQEMYELADNIREAILNKLWDEESQMFLQRDVKTDTFIPWKDTNNYYPMAEPDLVPADSEIPYEQALRYWADKEEFPIFPFFTANQVDKKAAAASGQAGSNNFANINASGDFRLFSKAIKTYNSEYISPKMYEMLIEWVAWAQCIDGNTDYMDNNEFWANYNKDDEVIDYRSWIHHNILGNYTYAIIEDFAGLTPRLDEKIELNPIDVEWDHFTVNNLRYHDQDLTIVWDAVDDGLDYYDDGTEGYSVYINGEEVLRIDQLAHVVWDPTTGEVEFLDLEKKDIDENNQERPNIILSNISSEVKDATSVQLTEDRVVKMFQNAAVDISEQTQDSINLALDAIPSASYTNQKTELKYAINGYSISGINSSKSKFTVPVPIWGTAGSENDKEWFALDFGTTQQIDDVKIYFYSDKNEHNYCEPYMYYLEYWNGSEWCIIPNQYKSDLQANFNHVQFPSISTEKLRVVMKVRPGYGVGLKEIQVFNTGVEVPAVINKAPEVLVYENLEGKKTLQATLITEVKDDALPSAILETKWSKVDGPGEVEFNNSLFKTTANFSEEGRYTLQVIVSDGELETIKDIKVEVMGTPNEVNVALDAEASTSFCSSWEKVTAVNDGKDPLNSTGAGQYGNWAAAGESQWVQYTWDEEVVVDKAEIFWFYDGGGILLPKSYIYEYRNMDTNEWEPVNNSKGYDISRGEYNTTTFEAVKTKEIRVKIYKSDTAWTGISEWRVFATPVKKVPSFKITTLVNEQPKLPEKVEVIYSNDIRQISKVTWPEINEDKLSKDGSFNIKGEILGSNQTINATIYVRTHNNVMANTIEVVNITIPVGGILELPDHVEVLYNDGSRDNVSNNVIWNDYNEEKLTTPGVFEIEGTVNFTITGEAVTTLKAKANITVLGEEPSNPGGGSSNPGGGSSNPGEEPSNPGGGSSNPGEEPSNPGGGSSNPGEEPSNPGEEPSDSEEEPSDSEEEPSDSENNVNSGSSVDREQIAKNEAIQGAGKYYTVSLDQDAIKLLKDGKLTSNIEIKVEDMDNGFKLQIKKDGYKIQSLKSPIILTIKSKDSGIDLENCIVVQGDRVLALSKYDVEKQTLNIALKDFEPITFRKKANIDFTDIQTLEDKQKINELATKNIVLGVTTNIFSPSTDVSRGQFVTMLNRVFNFSTTNKTTKFTDISPEHWAYEAVVATKELGIINGKSQTLFGVDNTITRQEMSVILYNALVYFDESIFDVKQIQGYQDEDLIADYAKQAVQELKNIGVLEGDWLEPREAVTRLEACSILYRMIEKLL